jgi:hypothetical protein
MAAPRALGRGLTNADLDRDGDGQVDSLDADGDGVLTRDEMMQAGESPDEDVHFTREKTTAANAIPSKSSMLFDHDHPISRQWKARRTSGRIFGMAVGLALPFLLSFTILSTERSFRGTAGSGRALIWKQEDASVRTDLQAVMEPGCWDELLLSNRSALGRQAWEAVCTPKDQQLAEGTLSQYYSLFFSDECPESTAEEPCSERTFVKENPGLCTIAVGMFWVLYMLWWRIISNSRLDVLLEQLVGVVEERGEWLVEEAANAVAAGAAGVIEFAEGEETETSKSFDRFAHRRAIKLTEKEKTKKMRRLANGFVAFVALVLSVFTVWVMTLVSQANVYGIKLWDSTTGDVTVQISQDSNHSKILCAAMMGLLVGGGLIGAPFFTSFADKDEEGHLVSKTKFFPILGFALVGIPFAVLASYSEAALDNAQPHVINSALNNDILTRADIDIKYEGETGFFAVQLSKLYRERENNFRNDVVQTILVMVCSIVWDIFVVSFHIMRPPHPKHRLRTDRRLSIYTHIFAGCGEIICWCCSFYLYDEGLPNQDTRLMLTYMCVLCSYTHAWTGAFQTPQVFGMQCVMIPAYGVVVFWKVVCATRVGLDPESLQKLVELFFIHQ